MPNVFERLRDMGDRAPQLFIAATGAGAGLQRAAWEPPGASSYLAGCELTYRADQTVRFLGFEPDVGPRGKPEYVTEKVAVDMAMAAYVRAWVPGRKAVGLGMTCSVASTREHRGDHRIVAAAFSDDGCHVASTVIPKGVGTVQRTKDGEKADRIAQELLRDHIQGTLRTFSVGGCLVEVTDKSSLARQRLFARPLFRADGTRTPAGALDPCRSVIFPGAFNPPHPGHFGAAEAATQAVALELRQCRELVYATTATHPIKPALTTVECLQRAKLMQGRSFLVSEGDGLYVEKARRFPGAVFAMGADTLDRMLDPRWTPVEPMLHEFHLLGTHFMVSRRKDGDRILDCDGVLRSRLKSVPMLTAHGHLFTPVDFQLDLSSTELRAKAGG